MDYEKKYKEALGWMQSVYPIMTGTVKEDAEHYFPELKESKESDEERIRKDIISYLKSSTAISPKTWIAWLEKQKVLTTEEDLQGKEDVLWCIKQAKKYAKDENEMGTCWFAEKWLEKQGKQGERKPTTEIKSAEESLGIDSDTYNKIVDECIYGDDEQKPDDKKGMNLVEEEMTPFQRKVFCIIDTAIEEEQCLKQVCDELLALASNEIKQKPAWSKEDEKMIHDIINDIAIAQEQVYCKSRCEDEIKWLKSLRPQKQWKPSDEQITSITCAVRKMKESACYDSELVSLFNDLKKLKYEK